MKLYLKSARDPISSLTHFIGLVALCIGFIFILAKGLYTNASLPRLISALAFSISAMLLYYASSYYHYYKGNVLKITWLRKFDHAMIYVLIAGSYTPMCYLCMDIVQATWFCIFVWGIAILGIVFKLLYINVPRFVGTLLYVLMGWMVLLDWNSFSSLPRGCLLLVFWGGIAYSIGAIIYAIKWPTINESWSFHEIFHVFIMVGTLLHYFAVYLYVL